MVRFLADNVLKLVAMAAAIDVFYVLLRDFGVELMVWPEATIAYNQLIGRVVALVGVIDTAFYWLAFGAVAVCVERIYRRG